MKRKRSSMTVAAQRGGALPFPVQPKVFAKKSS